MRVTLCVDALAPNPSGIGRYVWELSQGLRSHERIEAVAYFGRGRLIEDPQLLLAGHRFGRSYSPSEWLTRRRHRREALTGLVHGPNYFLPSFVPEGVITLHDLSVLRYPDTHPVERVRAFERNFASSLARARHIITDSETIRHEVVQGFGVPPDCVTAVHLGIDPSFRPRDRVCLGPSLAAWELEPGGYGLCVSTFEPRKNIGLLLDAWRSLPPTLRHRFPLVLAGASGWRNETLMTRLEQGASEGWIRNLGYVSENLLPALYAGAAVFAFPSFYEGFGLPPLEALASGVPTVVARASCLPEVCGDAATYFEPDDVSSLRQRLEEVLTHSPERTSDIARRDAHARSFTWNRCVNATVDVYKKAVKQV